MKSKLLFAAVVALLGMAAVPSFAQAQVFPHIRYTVKDLGAMGGSGTNSSGFDINNAGWVGGSGNLAPNGPQHAFLWYGRGPLIDAGTLGGPNSEADGPNLLGELPVFSDTDQTDPNGEDFCGFGTHLQCFAATWKNGKLKALPTLPGANNAAAYGINDLGQLAGFAETTVADSTCATAVPGQLFRYEAVIWAADGRIRKLNPVRGDTVGFAQGINDLGQVVGTTGLCSNTSFPLYQPTGVHAVLWEKDGTAVDLGNLGGGPGNEATAVNNLGHVVGNSIALDGSNHPFVWTKSAGIRDLGAAPGAVFTVAPCCRTINAADEVAGFWFDETFTPHAYIWRNGKYSNLDDLIPSNSGWTLLFSESINDAGEITGQGVINGELHAFLAIPHVNFGAANESVIEHGTRQPLPENVREQLRKQRRFMQFAPRQFRKAK